MKAARELLRLLSERFVTGRAKHNLTIGDKGELVVSVAMGDHWQTFHMDDADLDKDDPREVLAGRRRAGGHRDLAGRRALGG